MSHAVFRIKICGITSPEDAALAADAGADAIGLNFYPPSPRFVDESVARRIVEALPDGVARVGVFVNAPVEQVLRRAEQLRLDWVQLHGDESPSFVAAVAPRRVVRACRLGPEGLAALVDYLAQCQELGAMPSAVLVDACLPGQFGGTGQTADWDALAGYRSLHMRPALLLAGGLTAENVAAAIAAVRPDGVDTASGVESSPGRKDAARMRAFVAEARAAFARLGNTD